MDNRGAWFGNADLKAEVMERMLEHRAKDEIVQGTFQVLKSYGQEEYKGCALGCTLPLQAKTQDKLYKVFNWHTRVQQAYNLPLMVVEHIDNTFENQHTFLEAAEFAVTVIDNIPVGADLSVIADEIYTCVESDWNEHEECWVCVDNMSLRAEEFIKRLATAPITEAARAMILVA